MEGGRVRHIPPRFVPAPPSSVRPCLNRLDSSARRASPSLNYHPPSIFLTLSYSHPASVPLSFSLAPHLPFSLTLSLSPSPFLSQERSPKVTMRFSTTAPPLQCSPSRVAALSVDPARGLLCVERCVASRRGDSALSDVPSLSVYCSFESTEKERTLYRDPATPRRLDCTQNRDIDFII